MLNHLKIFILAGGIGSRLWPLSTQKIPKQFLKLGSIHSFLQKTILRYKSLCLEESIFIVSSYAYEKILKEQLEELNLFSKISILLETSPNNTAKAVAWSVETLLNEKKIHHSDLILVSPVDHIYSCELTFINHIKRALNLYQTGSLLGFCLEGKKINPLFGYLKYNTKDLGSIKKSLGFIEKPSRSLCRRLLEDGWEYNSGLYAFDGATLIQEMKAFCPEFLESEKKLEQKNLSLDQALIEKTKNLLIYPLTHLDWIDIGSWTSLEKYLSNLTLAKNQTEVSALKNLKNS